MTFDFSAHARWLPRDQTLREVAGRWLKVVERLRDVSPMFQDWYSYDQRWALQPLPLTQSSVIAAIAAGIEKDEDRNPLPGTTHTLSAWNTPTEIAGPKDFQLTLKIDQNWKHANNFVGFAPPFTIDDQDPACVTYAIYRAAVLALAEEFEATFAQAYSHDLMLSWPQGRERPDLPPTWISYLGPRYAQLVTPPDTAVVEYRPDGGLLMAATRTSSRWTTRFTCRWRTTSRGRWRRSTPCRDPWQPDTYGMTRAPHSDKPAPRQETGRNS